jgi:CubicO group peptidase (beta-lactamase class C family)
MPAGRRRNKLFAALSRFGRGKVKLRNHWRSPLMAMSLPLSTSTFVRLSVLAAFAAIFCCLPVRPQEMSGDAGSREENAARIARIESDVAAYPVGPGQTPLHFSLQQLMAQFHDPGLSLAVIDHFGIIWTKGYGVVEAGSDTPVTTKTLFQAGSISKPVAATGALYLVEHGNLALDEDVNKKLITWKVPENDFTTTEKVTLRRILSHSAGLTVHGFPGYSTDASLPTLRQILDGEKPANTPPVRVDLLPGSKVVYSGGGVTVEQLLVMDVTGKPFPQFMKQVVLDKLGMTHSTYEQPLPAALAPLAATGTYPDGKSVVGKWHVYPEMAAAGLWTTPTDLAKFGIEIAKSKHGNSNLVLSESMTRQMLTPQIENAGLGFFMAPGNANRFEHGGADEGFQAMFIMLGDEGQGAVVMTNSDNGIKIANHLIESIAREYRWKFEHDKPSAGEVLDILTDQKGTKAALQEYAELKKTSANGFDFTADDLNQMGYALLNQKKFDEAIEALKLNVEMYPNSGNVYDSLGEAYMDAGRTDLAIQNYEKSLQLDPKNENAVTMLKRLKDQK